MTGVRVLVGTRKGAFILTSDGTRKTWQIDGPHFGGWEIYHVNGSRADPNRLFASQSTGWHGQIVQRSDDGGRTWTPVGNEFAYEGATGTHRDLAGETVPFEFRRVWHFEPSPVDPDTVFAGVEDAALFRSGDAGQTWQELTGVRQHPSAAQWDPGAGGMCLHTILINPAAPDRMHLAISSAGAMHSADGGKSWTMANAGMTANYMPEGDAEVGFCVHNLAQHPSRPDIVFMQQHDSVWRSDDGGNSWTNVNGNLPSDFGFCIDVHAHEPETIYVVPITSGELHYPPDGKLAVYRSRTGGNEWERLDAGLPPYSYVNVLRDAMATDDLDSCGVYFGTTGGEVYASADAGDSWAPIAEHLPAVLSVEVQTLS